MSAPDTAVERWQDVQRALLEGAPLSDEARQYLCDVAQKITLLADDFRLPSEHVAALIPDALRLTGRAIRSYRDTRQAESARWLMKTEGHLQPATKRESIVTDVARMLGVSASTVRRRMKR
jgi:hypothetical protein